MKLTAVLIIQLFLLKCNLSASREFYAYKIEIVQFKALQAEEKLLIDFGNVRVVGRERYLNGTVEIRENMGEKNFQFSMDFQHDPDNNGKWHPTKYGVPVMNICTAMKVFMGTYGKSTLQKGVKTNLPFDGRSCPLRRGTYYIRNMLMNTDSWPGVLPVGGLELNMRFYKHGKSIGGASFTLNIQ